MATYGVASSYTLMMELAQLMGAPLFKADGWAQSSHYPVSPFGSGVELDNIMREFDGQGHRSKVKVTRFKRIIHVG